MVSVDKRESGQSGIRLCPIREIFRNVTGRYFPILKAGAQVPRKPKKTIAPVKPEAGDDAGFCSGR